MEAKRRPGCQCEFDNSVRRGTRVREKLLEGVRCMSQCPLDLCSVVCQVRAELDSPQGSIRVSKGPQCGLEAVWHVCFGIRQNRF